MRFYHRLIRTLILPSNAGPNDPAVIIGPDIPSEVEAYYAPDFVVECTVYRYMSGLYFWQAFVVPELSDPYVATGVTGVNLSDQLFTREAYRTGVGAGAGGNTGLTIGLQGTGAGSPGAGLPGGLTYFNVIGNATVGGDITAATGHFGGGSGDAVFIGDDAKLVDINHANALGVWGQQDPTTGELRFGNGSDVNLRRASAGILATDVTFGAFGGIWIPANAPWVDDGKWQAWNPSLLNITLGNGTIDASYTKFGKTCHFLYVLVFGTTTSIIATPTGITLPFTPAANYPNDAPIGWGEVNFWPAQLLTANGIGMGAAGVKFVYFAGGQATNVDSTHPGGVAAGTRIAFSGTYRIA